MTFDISAVSAAGSLLMSFGNLIGKVNDQSLKSELLSKQIELQQKFMELQAAYAAMADENRSLRSELGDLQLRLSFQGKLTLTNSVYWQILTEGLTEAVPYCPICWDAERKAVHLIRCGDAPNWYWHCSLHNQSF